MLMSTKANRQAHLLMKARASGKFVVPLSVTVDLNLEQAYDIAKCILDCRIALGEQPVGRKLAYANQNLWPNSTPIWSTLYEQTVHFADDNTALHQLGKAQQPRIEAELVFKLARTPAPDATLEEMADCLEWMAHGFGIVVSPFEAWKFSQADAVAAFGLHRALIVGEPRMLSRQTRRNLPTMLSSASVSLSRSAQGNTHLCAAGFGTDALNSPLHALLQLHQQLQQQFLFSHLQAGELISTGSWTHPHPVARGEVWSSAFSQISMPGLNLSFS